MRGLKDKWVMITGASSGIGRATARRFYEEGSQLCLVDLKEDDSLEAEFPERHHFIQADVTVEADVLRLEAFVAEHGLWALVNNAGIVRDATITKMGVDAWDAVVAVNLSAVWRLCKMAAGHMSQQGGGVILNAASVVAHYGNFGQSNYVATKAGVIGLTKSLSKELGRFGVRVNAVAPGFIDTPMTANMPEKVLTMVVDKVPLKRMGHVQEVAAAYAFLASDDAAYISGATLNVDGGIVVG